MNRPGPIGACLIDIEGVLVRDKRYEPVPGAVAWFEDLVRRGLPFCLVSNNTTHEPSELLADLRAAGFAVAEEHLVTALELGRRWLQQRGRRRIQWLGHPRLADWWSRGGFDPQADDAAEAVVLGANPELSMADLEAVLPAVLDGGVDVVCLHRNRFWLDATGRRRPGPGAWAAALEALGGAGRIITVGKPAETIYHEARKRVGVESGETLFISDDPEADLVTAGRLGMRTAFVLSGKHTDHGVLSRLNQEDWPDLVCSRLADIDLDEGAQQHPGNGK